MSLYCDLDARGNADPRKHYVGQAYFSSKNKSPVQCGAFCFYMRVSTSVVAPELAGDYEIAVVVAPHIVVALRIVAEPNNAGGP